MLGHFTYKLRQIARFVRGFLRRPHYLLTPAACVRTLVAYFAIGSGNFKNAERNLRAALARSPNFIEAHYGLGYTLMRLGSAEEAILHFKRAIELKPRFGEGLSEIGAVYAWLGAAYHVIGRIDEAVQAWAEGMEVQRDAAEEAGLTQGIHYLTRSFVSNIGHIALLDLIAKRYRLGLSGKYVVLAEGHVANRAYLDHWRDHFEIITNQKEIARLRHHADLLTDWPTVVQVDGRWHFFHNAYAVIEERWEAAGLGPLISLRAEQVAQGRAAIEQLGLPASAWFATLHVREVPDPVRTARNAPISDYQLAIRRVTDAGGWVVRIGNPSMTPLPPMERVIDYAHSPIRKDWIDVFLISQCRFFVGTNSGPVWAAKTFGVPTLLTNWSPIGIQSHASDSIMLPRLAWSDRENRYLHLAEQFRPPVVHTEVPEFLSRIGIRMVNNSPAEISEAVGEMLDPMKEREEDRQLQVRFSKIATDAGTFGRGRIARSFLQRHRDLL